MLVKEFEDAEFAEELVEIDGSHWVKVKTDHFSPYALIDELPDAEKGVKIQDDGPSDSSSSSSGHKDTVPTGDHETQIAVVGLGSIL